MSDRRPALFDFIPDEGYPVSDLPHAQPAADTAPEPARRKPRRAGARALTLFLALAAIPLASDRPAYWLGWAALLCLAAGLATLRGALPPLARAGPARWLFAAFLAFIALQCLPFPADIGGQRSLSATPRASALAGLRWLSYGALFALTMAAATRGPARRSLSRGCLAIIAAHAFAALLVELMPGLPLPALLAEGYPGAVTGSFVNRNAFAAFMGLGVILALSRLAVLVGPDGSPDRLPLLVALHGALLLGMSAALLGTGSRMGLLAALAGALVPLTALTRGLRLRFGPRGLAFGGGAVLIWAALLLPQATLTAERLWDILPGAGDRLELYRQVAAMIAADPWTGSGLDTFEIAFQRVHAPPLSPDAFWDKAHSTYLQLWAEAGVIAGSLPPLMVGLLLWRIGRASPGGATGTGLRLAALGASIQLGLHAGVDFVIETPAVTYCVIVLLAAALPQSAHKQSLSQP